MLKHEAVVPVWSTLELCHVRGTPFLLPSAAQHQFTSQTGPRVFERVKSEVVVGVAQTSWPHICWRQGNTGISYLFEPLLR